MDAFLLPTNMNGNWACVLGECNEHSPTDFDRFSLQHINRLIMKICNSSGCWQQMIKLNAIGRFAIYKERKKKKYGYRLACVQALQAAHRLLH